DEDAVRGFHAHKKNRQMLFCIQGSITILLDDGNIKENVVLDKPNHGIYLDKMIWHEMKDFHPDTILLVLASEYFEEKDYVRNYQEFLKLCHQPKNLKDKFFTFIHRLFKNNSILKEFA